MESYNSIGVEEYETEKIIIGEFKPGLSLYP